MHDDRHGDAQGRLQDDGDHAEERRIPGGDPEALARGSENIGVILQADEGGNLRDEPGRLVQSRLAVKRLLEGLEDGNNNDDRQDYDRRRQKHPGEARLRPAGPRPAVDGLR